MSFLSQLGIDWHHIVIQIINFSLLLFILKRFLYKPVLGVLAKRKKDVEDALALNEQIKTEYTELEKYKSIELEKVEKETKRIMAEVMERATKTAQHIESDARTRSEDMLNSARAIILQEKERIIEDLHSDISHIALGIAEKVLSEKLKGDEGEQYIKKVLQ